MGKRSKPIRAASGYDISLKIKGEDYTPYLSEIRIVSSLISSWPIINLVIGISPKDIILEKLYGQDAIELNIKLLGQNKIPNIQEQIDFELMLVASEFDVPVSSQTTQTTQEDLTYILLKTIPRKSFKSLSTMVNKIYGYVNGKTLTPKEIIEDIINSYSIDCTLEYDNENSNSDIISQLCIPPMTFGNVIKMLEYKYGLFDGACTSYFDKDNILKIMNLSSRIKKASSITIQHLSFSSKDTSMEKSWTDKGYYYTYDDIHTTYTGNSRFGHLGKTLKHIVFPNDSLYHIITHDLDDICKNYGLIDKNTEMYVDSKMLNRTKYYIDKGYEKSETFANARIAKQLFDLSRISFSVERNIFIEELLNIGSVVRFNTETLEYVDLSGKYILYSSDISIHKENEWQVTAALDLARTNKTIA